MFVSQSTNLRCRIETDYWIPYIPGVKDASTESLLLVLLRVQSQVVEQSYAKCSSSIKPLKTSLLKRKLAFEEESLKSEQCQEQ